MNTGRMPPRFPLPGAEPNPLETLAFAILGIAVGASERRSGSRGSSRVASSAVLGRAWVSGEMGGVLARFAQHAADPREAWPASEREPDPGSGRLLRDARTRPQPARRRRLRPASPTTRRCDEGRSGRALGAGTRSSSPFAFANRSPGRLTLGLVDGRLVAAEPRQSVIVVGPVQTGKTTGFAVPAILEWQGPVVATSVKTDLLRETIAARSAIS